MDKVEAIGRDAPDDYNDLSPRLVDLLTRENYWQQAYRAAAKQTELLNLGNPFSGAAGRRRTSLVGAFANRVRRVSAVPV